MSAIQNINEPWRDHSGLEVETFLKAQIVSTIASIGGKIGYVEMVGTDMKFYDYEGGTVIATIPLGGDVYTITVLSNVTQSFYVLADEATKIMEITPSTVVGSFGSSVTEDFPEDYSYIVAVNTGNGYVNRLSGNIANDQTASFDIRPFLATGDNYVRVSVTGLTSGQTKTVVYTGTLTTLTMSCNHDWNTIWEQGNDYVITGIRFAGSMEKVLHVSVNDVELEPVAYSAGQSYTTTATTYTIPSSAFPYTDENGVCSIKLWMTAQGVSTPVVPFNIICTVADDDTPMVSINRTRPVVNFTSATVFSYVCYNCDNIKVSMSATLGETTYPIVSDYAIVDRSPNTQYDFSYAFEVDTGINNVPIGTLDITVVPYSGTTAGETATAQTSFDNTYSYLATPDALFYMNASTRSNSEDNKDKVVNEMGASEHFAASYDTTSSGISYFNDMWGVDEDGYKALVVPAGASLTIDGFAPCGQLASFPNGLSIEFMLKSEFPSDYSEPIFKMLTTGAAPNGIVMYPTKIVVLGSSERSEVVQSVNFSENRITHFVVTFSKNYGGVANRNLVSVYVNGISNVNFAFNGGSSFGNADLVIGQPNTDVYLYKMRVYGSALEPQAVFNNFLNAIFDNVEFNRRETDAKNDLLDGGVIGYEKVKSAGYNTMVVIMDNDQHDIPSFNNNAVFDHCSLRFEYAGHPEWNVSVGDVSLDGQGTTSKKYYRWNLRAKTGSSTTWTYGDGNTATGKKGYFVNDGVHGKVDRITAKKNYASSMQGHKMGLTGLYNDIYHQIGLGSHLPDDDYQVAVFELPFVGFKYNATNDTYTYIGQYTAGPDKGSKVTFGYSADYTHLLSIEGPNHAPRGTRFLHPWVDVTYDSGDETLKFGGEEGWDCDYVGNDLSSDKAADAPAILALYESEWRPAYECVFNNSPYIVSASEMISALNNPSINSVSALCNAANTDAIFAGSTNGYSNQLLSFYDTSYEIYFYRTKDLKFVKMSDVDTSLEHNAVTNLRSGGYLSTNTPTTAQIVAARAARFKAVAPNYWDIDQTLYHYVYCLLFGVTDNFAKNSYPFKFEPLQGSSNTDYAARWGWREDDLDTALMTDNNGQNTKSYSVEHGDTADGVEIYQGGNSALWVLIRDNYATETRSMMQSMTNAMATIATSLGIQGNGLHESVFNVTGYYCWQHSSKYFSQTLYEGDRAWSYIEPWLINPSQTYNGVYPLTQALGDQFQAESLWVMRRIAYIFSKFRIGVFTGDNTGWNTMAFTLNSPFTFNIKPAIDLYPVVTLANSQDVQGTRTQAGQSVALQLIADGQTTNYIKAVDWLEELGDLSGMVLTARGGGQITFSAIGNRLKKLKIGDEVASNVHFNADVFTVESPALIELDARNTTTLTGTVSLLACPRLRKVLFAGSTANGLELPIYGKVEEVSFPETCSTVFLHSLTLLKPSKFTLPDTSGIVNLYMNNCDFLNPFDTVNEILADENNTLAYLGLIFREPVVFTDLADLTNVIYHQWAGRYIYENGSTSIQAGEPYIEGTIDASNIMLHTGVMDYLEAGSVIETVQGDIKKYLASRYKTALYLIVDTSTTTVFFRDANVKSICVANWDTNSNGEIEVIEAAAVTSLATKFKGNTSIEYFNELKYFTSLVENSFTNEFYGCTSLKSITIPNNLHVWRNHVFQGCSSLEEIHFNGYVQTTANYTFSGTSQMDKIYFETLDDLFQSSFYNSVYNYAPFSVSGSGHIYVEGQELTDIVVPDSVTSINGALFMNCKYIESISFNEILSSIGRGSFYGCSGLTGDLVIPSLVTAIGEYAFYKCSGLESIDIHGASTSIGQYAFNGCTSLTEISGLEHVTSIGDYCFGNCSSLVNLFIPISVTTGWIFVDGNTNNPCGAGTGVLMIDGDFTYNGKVARILFKQVIVNGSFSTPYHSLVIGDKNSLRVKGTISSTYTQSNNGMVNSVDPFIEGMSNVSVTKLIIGSNNQSTAAILHFGYNSVVSTTPTQANISKIAKVYVGDGSSRASDEALLDLYLADTNWSAQSAKLATWYDYNGEYKWYYVTDVLTNCTNTNPDEWPHITRGEEYRTTIKANAGYTLQSVQVQMYQCEDNTATPDTPTDITSAVYNASTGDIYIQEVVGNVIITASAS